MEAAGRTSKIGARMAAVARPTVENCLFFPTLDSTQACALRLIDQAEEEELTLPTTLIIAGRQDKGRGRSDRTWQSPTGGLYISLVTSELDRKLVAKLPMIAAAAAAEAVIGIGIGEITIKWPNDLLVNGRKLAGLLVHARLGAVAWAAVGLGVNLESTPAVPHKGLCEPTSVADLLPPADIDFWAEKIVETFVIEMAAGIASPEAKLDLWRERLIHRVGDGMTVRLGDAAELRGRFSGLTEEGHLRLDCDGAERVVSAGDVVEWVG